MVFSWPTLHISGLYVAEVMHEKCQNGCVFLGNGGSHTQLATWASVFPALRLDCWHIDECLLCGGPQKLLFRFPGSLDCAGLPGIRVADVETASHHYY